MRSIAATLGVALSLLLPAAAAAAPTDVGVRIEGAGQTIFDRTIAVDGHDVRASSDTQARHCDGTNAGASATPGPTATSAAVDALSSIGQTFDGQWYPGFDDYFVTRLGSGSEDDDKGWWWGILVNGAFTPVGGCQLQVHADDQVLWVLDAFGSRRFLWLAGPRTAELGQPLNVTVTSTDGNATPNAATDARYAGAQVGPVDANGLPAAAGIADDGVSGADGSATVVFHQAGWQRLKARATGTAASGDEAAVASNSVDVCVEATPGAGCDTPPPSRQAPPTGSAGTSATSQAPRLGRPQLVLDAARGRVTAAWTVLDAGPGVRDWSILTQQAGLRGARWVARTGGGPDATHARVPLPAGVGSRVRLRMRDTAGHVVTLALGSAFVPRDDRTLTTGRGWTRAHDGGAWLGTVTRGRPGATLTTRFAAGRPLFVLRSGHASARLELRAGGRVRRVTIAGGRTAKTLRVLAPARSNAGSVALTVLSGTVSVDGAGLGA